MELGDSYGRVGVRIVSPEGDRNSTERPTELTNLDSSGFQESLPPIKEHTWAGPARPPHSYVADVQGSLHLGLEQLEQGLS